MTIRVAIYSTTRITTLPQGLNFRSYDPSPSGTSQPYPIHSYSLKVTPAEHFINWQQDAYGNFLARIVFPEKTRELSVEVEVIADMTVINPFDFFLEEYAENFPFK